MSAGSETSPARARLADSLRIAVASGALQLRQQWSPAIVVLGVAQPAAFFAVTLLASRGGDELDPGSLALGMALLGLWGTTVWQAGTILRFEQAQGTLAAVASRPVRLSTVVAGKVVGATVRAVLFVVPTVAVASAAAGDPFPVARPLPFLAAALAIVASAAVLGMLLASIFLITRSAGRVAEALTYPVFIFGGLVVPLSLLPWWTRPFSALVPLRWGGELLRAAAEGRSQAPRAWAMLLLTTAAYAVLASSLFERIVTRARREGTLELF